MPLMAYLEKNRLSTPEAEQEYYLKTADDVPYPEITFDWTEEDEESMKKVCPGIYEKYRAGPF